MQNYVKIDNLQVSQLLYNFVNSEVLPGSGINQEKFWSDFDGLIHELSPINKQLLDERSELQEKINKWHKEHKTSFNFGEYKTFLQEIGYLEPKVEDFNVSTENVDSEVATQAGPQLVVPVDNARYALNAANARWGSLYDALYGTDVIGDEDGAEAGKSYNPIRGAKVVSFAKNFLDEAVPLVNAIHAEVQKYTIVGGQLAVTLQNGETTHLNEATKFVGYQGQPEEPVKILLVNNGMHIEIQIDRNHPIGKTDLAGVKDVYLEAALSMIMDFEDSIAAVDAEDKVHVYRNWLGLMKGDLTASFPRGNKTVTRTAKR